MAAKLPFNCDTCNIRSAGPYCAFCGQATSLAEAAAFDDASYSPADICERFHLPVEVKVTKGYCDPHEMNSLAEGEIFTIIDTHTEEVVVAKDRARREIVVPLHLDALWYLLEDQDKKRDDGGLGGRPIYDRSYTISEIAHSFQLPIVVRLAEGQELDDVSESSTYSLTLLRVETRETLICASDDSGKDLMAIPINLDIELCGNLMPRHKDTRRNLFSNFGSFMDMGTLRGVGQARLGAARMDSKALRMRLKEAEILVMDLREELSDWQAAYEEAVEVLQEAAEHFHSRAISEGSSESDITKLLHHLKLDAYCDSFADASINGHKFLQLTDAELKRDFHVKNDAHRARILNAKYMPAVQ